MNKRKKSTGPARQKSARRRKTPAAAESESVSRLAIYERINRFDAQARRELRKFMRNAIERMLAAGRGEPLPPKYDYEAHLDDFE